MEKKEFTSRTVQEAEYDDKDRVLIITYVTGKRYKYTGVPEIVWDAMKSAESVGSFVSSSIKGQYQYKML